MCQYSKIMLTNIEFSIRIYSKYKVNNMLLSRVVEGSGPVKPGNLCIQGAKSSGILIPKDKKEY